MADTVEQKSDAKPSNRMTPGLVWSAVRHHPILFLALLVTTVCAGAAAWAFLPLPKNTAAVVFQVSNRAPRVISSTQDNQLDLNSYKQRQAALIKKRSVLNAVKKRPEAAQTALLQQVPPEQQLAWLERVIEVDTSRGGSEFVRVYMEGDQADDMLAIIKALTFAYLAEVDLLENGARNQQLQSLEDAINRQKSEIEGRQKNIDSIATTLNYSSPATMVIFEQLMQDELRVARREVIEADHLLALARPNVEKPEANPDPDKPDVAAVIPTAVIDDALRRDPAVQAADAKVLVANQDLLKLEGQLQAGTVNAAVLKARDTVKTAVAELEQLKADLRGRLQMAYKDQLAIASATARELAAERLRDLERRKTVADAQMKEVIARINKHTTMAADLSKFQKEIASQEKLLAAMTEEREKMRVEDKAPRRVSVSEEPYVAVGVEGSRRWRNAGIAAAAPFILGMVGLVAWEYRRKRVSRPDELATALGLPLLGVLPSTGAAGPNAKRELVEAIDSARTALLYRQADTPPRRTLVVTSGLPGEGKTSLSSHLAVSLARAGFRTLLVDGDVHRPSLHTLFALPASPGLCELLRGETRRSIAVHPTTIPGLSVIPAGVWNLAARQALVRDRWLSLRAELETEFDYLVIDTAPLLLMTDTQLLAQAADGVILSALVGVSETTQSALTCQRLNSLGVSVLGVVVGGDTSAFKRRYRYYLTDGENSDSPTPLSKS